MSSDVENLLLSEFRGLRDDMQHWQLEISVRLQRLETQVHPLFDNGQPGICSRHSSRLDAVEEWKYKWLAIGAAAMVIITLAVDAALIYVRQ